MGDAVLLAEVLRRDEDARVGGPTPIERGAHRDNRVASNVDIVDTLDTESPRATFPLPDIERWRRLQQRVDGLAQQPSADHDRTEISEMIGRRSSSRWPGSPARRSPPPSGMSPAIGERGR
jgi:hypothetical protein